MRALSLLKIIMCETRNFPPSKKKPSPLSNTVYECVSTVRFIQFQGPQSANILTQIDNTATSYNDEQKIPTFPGSLIFPCTAKWTRSHAKQPCRAGKIFHQTSYSGNSRIIPKCFKLHVKHASRSLVILLKPKTQDGELKKRDSCCSDKRKCTIYYFKIILATQFPRSCV